MLHARELWNQSEAEAIEDTPAFVERRRRWARPRPSTDHVHFALFAAIIMVLSSTMVSQATTHTTVDVQTQLPYTENYTTPFGGPFLEVSIDLVNVTEYTVLYVIFNRSANGLDQGVLLRPLGSPSADFLGYIEAGYNIFAVPLEGDSTLEFTVVDWTWMQIDRVPLEGRIPNPSFTNVQYAGWLYREEFQHPGGTSDLGYRALLEVPFIGVAVPVDCAPYSVAEFGLVHNLTVDGPVPSQNAVFDILVGGATGVSSFAEVAASQTWAKDVGSSVAYVKVAAEYEGRFRVKLTSVPSADPPAKECRADLFSGDVDLSWTGPINLNDVVEVRLNVTNRGDGVSTETSAELHLDSVLGAPSRIDAAVLPSLGPLLKDFEEFFALVAFGAALADFAANVVGFIDWSNRDPFECP